MSSSNDEFRTFLPRVGRVKKSHPRVEAFGCVDELSCFVGLARAVVGDEEVRDALKKVQDGLFHVGSYLALLNHPLDRVAVVMEVLKELENVMNARLQPLNRFIYPSGVYGATLLHVCRAVARRAERTVVRLGEVENVDPLVVSFLNYLSKFFFTAARYVNMKHGGVEEEWVSR